MSLKKDKSRSSPPADISSDVLRTIKKENIKCRPKYYFVIGSSLIGVGVGIVILASVFLVNIKLYQIEMFRPFDWLSFGFSGIWPFLILFPWKVLMLAMGVLVLGVYLVRMSKDTVHLRLSTIALIIIVVSASGAVAFTHLKPLNIRINHYLSSSSLFGYLYDSRYHGSNWLMGRVASVGKDYIIINCQDHDRPVKVSMGRSVMGEHKNDVIRDQELELMGKWRGPYAFEAIAIKPVYRQNILRY